MTKEPIPEIQKKQKPKEMREEIREHLDGLGAPLPHLQLASYSAGVDPSGLPSRMYELLKQCNDRRQNGSPRAEDWDALWDFVVQNPAIQAGFVDQDMRFQAAVQLMPYLHPKLKSIQVSGELEHLVRVVPLTEEAIKRIKAHLDNDF
jgi:hypothetical protein